MNRIKELRMQKGILQKDLAKMLGVSQQTCSNYEAGRHEPDNESIRIMTEFFGVSADYLLGISEKNNELDDMSYALMREARELTDEEKQQLIDMAQFLRSRRK